ncbi:nucleotidyltransferase [Gracilibacillus sp. YIM 98692]|uniref:nucleotidyltransferase n=1 Tax=Gracilibacillus sp. YIM 98692 TaxID=2663532 RepID=UPI0013D8A642|nr:nucleotidyltransferase [Gracilibacillus sp. YIM 98692]
MKACGLIVEYNPYHNGHHYHFQEAKKQSGADCMIAVMSGNFLQRGEPAIIDKFERAKIAIDQGIDLVIELPFFYAVQHSELFAKGAVQVLNQLFTDMFCFGSEHGEIAGFQHMYDLIHQHLEKYEKALQDEINKGSSYPKAHEVALYHIGGEKLSIDFSKPNNILGYQYVKHAYQLKTSLKPFTIKRMKNDYHDQTISNPIASATSIRNQLFSEQTWSKQLQESMPAKTRKSLLNYYDKNGKWHYWEHYFPLLQYRILTSSFDQLHNINGMKEGLEHRIYRAAKQSHNFQELMEKVKTKRYTWTSLQRIFTYILTNTSKAEISNMQKQTNLSSLRVLAMSEQGRLYLNNKKKSLQTTIAASIKEPYPYKKIDERLSNAYYSIMDPHIQQTLLKQEYKPPYLPFNQN